MKHWRDVAELVGGACVVAAAWMWEPVAGLALSGIGLVLVANFAGGDRARTQ